MTEPHSSGTDGITRRTALKTAVLTSAAAAVGVPAVAGSAAAKRPHCDVLVDPATANADASTIQGGVDAAVAGDTVCVADGTYTEQVVVDKDLVLTNARGATPTIVAPASPAQFTIAESGATWEPVVFAYGGSESGGAVTGSGTVDVSISGFTVDGNDRTDGTRPVGVLLRNVRSDQSSHAGVESNVVENMGVGGRETFGILVYGDSSVGVVGNDVREYERGGIGANGNGVDPAPTVEVRGNTVTGSTGVETAWAPNGIQLGYGASGSVESNVVSDNRWSADEDGDWVASGIIVFESDDVQVRRNTVTNSDVGISVGSWGWFRGSADGNTIMRNEIHDAHAGVVLQGVAWEGYSSTDPSASNNKVVGNMISDSVTGDDDVGIAVDSTDADPEFDPSVWNNKVVRNAITGYATEISDDGSATKTAGAEP